MKLFLSPISWLSCWGVACLYPLCKRVMGAWWALAATLLYATQPLLFGHAFINPKDTPFLGMMLASVYAGLCMVDHYRSPAPAGQCLQPWLGESWADCPLVQQKTNGHCGSSLAGFGVGCYLTE